MSLPREHEQGASDAGHRDPAYKKGEGTNQVLLNCTKRLGENDEPKMKDILDLLSGDRQFAPSTSPGPRPVRLCRVSLGDMPSVGIEST